MTNKLFRKFRVSGIAYKVFVIFDSLLKYYDVRKQQSVKLLSLPAYKQDLFIQFCISVF